jgi:hypothetical protein
MVLKRFARENGAFNDNLYTERTHQWSRKRPGPAEISRTDWLGKGFGLVNVEEKNSKLVQNRILKGIRQMVLKRLGRTT